MSLHPVKRGRYSGHRFPRLKSKRRRASWASWNTKASFPFKPNGKFNPFFAGKKGKALVLILLSLSIVFGADQILRVAAPGPTNHPSPIDPYTALWTEFFTSGDISGYNCHRATYVTVAGIPGIQLNSDNNGPGICLSQSPVDISTVSGKELEFNFAFHSSYGSLNSEFGWYITRNNTLPGIGPDSNYRPENDTSVALFDRMTLQAGLNVLHNVLIQTKATETIAKGQYPTCAGGTGGGVCFAQTTLSAGAGVPPITLHLNFTGETGAAGGNMGRSYISHNFLISNFYSIFHLPWLEFQAQKYYIGFFVVKGTFNQRFLAQSAPFSVAVCPPSGNPCMSVGTAVVSTIAPQIDTGGFFGPIIKALIAIGVFILNAVLQFVAFIAPGVQSAIIFLETLVQNVLNSIGNAIGWGNLGDDLFSFINSIIQFLTGAGCSNPCGLPAFFTNFPTLFTAFINANIVYFQWIVFPLWFASNLLTFAVNAIPQAILYMNLFVNLLATGWSFYLIMSFMIYTGDDALGGLLAWVESAQWLAIGTLHWVAIGINYALDFIVLIISLIPKPIIQMNAGKVPRLPVIDTSARFITPTFDLGELRSGNMFSAFLWLAGFNFVIWYESRNPALPGAIGAILPSTQSIMMNTGFMLGLLNLMLIVTGAWCMFWVVMRPIHLLGMDLGMFEGFGVGPGRKISSGPKGVHVSRGSKKLFQGGVQKKAAAQSYFNEQGHIEKGVGTSGAVSTGALFT